MSDLAIFSKDAADRTETCVIAFEHGSGHQPRGRKVNRQLPYMPPIRAILLEDLPDGGTADATVTVRDETTFIQKISIIGDVSAGSFILAFQNVPTAAIAFNATAAALQAILEAHPLIGKGNVLVQLGKQTFDDEDGDGGAPDSATAGKETANPAVWLVHFVGTFTQGASPQPPPLFLQYSNTLRFNTFGGIVLAATEHWVDSGVIERIVATIPVGTPTPMRAGAVVCVVWFPGVGYGFPGCEARVFSQTYY